MAIDNLDELLRATRAGAFRLPMNRASLSSQIVGHETSLWRGVGFPTQGAIPAAAAITDNATTGALPLAPRSGGQNRIISQVSLSMAALGHALFIEDRLGHMGGLSGIVTTAQTVSLSIHANLATSNIAQRIGSANYSEIEWYLDWYITTGATVSTPTAQVTFNDGSTGNVNVSVLGATALPASVAASRRYKLTPTNGLFIRSVESVTLSASTTTAGSFGVTAVRRLATLPFIGPAASMLFNYDVWALNSPEIFDQACVTFSQLTNATSSGTTSGNIIQAVN